MVANGTFGNNCTASIVTYIREYFARVKVFIDIFTHKEPTSYTRTYIISGGGGCARLLRGGRREVLEGTEACCLPRLSVASRWW